MSEPAGDVIVVGGGNAAMCAALSAREQGARVLVVEKAPEAWRGGNGFFTAGGFRFAFKSFEEVCALVGDLSDEEKASMDVPLYTEDAYYDDLMRVTEDLADADLALTLARESQPTMRWMKSQGIRWIPMFGRQAYRVGGRFTFFGNLVLEAVGGGPGLIDMEYESAKKAGIDVRFEAKAHRLLTGARGAVTGVEIKTPDGGRERLEAKTVVLASGGFEANVEMRTRYLGPNWDLARVRGTPYNTGDGIRMALEIGAQPWGNWSGCHAVQWDYNAPWHGDRKVGDNFQKHSYPLGLIVNVHGERFVDEGADMRNYTYVKYGREVIKQPRRAAFQIFDQKVVGNLREEYRIREVTKAEADTFEELARKLEIDVEGFVRTIRAYNAAVQPGPYNPAIKDGKATRGIAPPKSNWALPLDTPPYVGYAVTTGITFTFGGLRITLDGQVIDAEQRPIPGLYAAGELVGGLFYTNYPGGSGLMAGSVFGRIAGRSAARAAKG
ncbi:MAG: FAD-dependent tricarballylate dehydrogenase TcuA [Candidatus Rokubacteria bacterium]|nr:FAD-dependent tricarballylate dehydrogenase TcuA [Candidatus Rokubacteria bacterium]MBI3827859.1 FAD-dependent tricarballylate dehydrogenase TcuA [Candidatus Rokubacteria bacterium]